MKNSNTTILIHISTTVPQARLACGFNCCSGIPLSFHSQQFRNSFRISILRLEILPEFESVRKSDKFRKDWLKVSSFSGTGIPEIWKCTHSLSKLLFSLKMSINECPGASANVWCRTPGGPRPTPKIPQKSHVHATAFSMLLGGRLLVISEPQGVTKPHFGVL